MLYRGTGLSKNLPYASPAALLLHGTWSVPCDSNAGGVDAEVSAAAASRRCGWIGTGRVMNTLQAGIRRRSRRVDAAGRDPVRGADGVPVAAGRPGQRAGTGGRRRGAPVLRGPRAAGVAQQPRQPGVRSVPPAASRGHVSAVLHARMACQRAVRHQYTTLVSIRTVRSHSPQPELCRRRTVAYHLRVRNGIRWSCPVLTRESLMIRHQHGDDADVRAAGTGRPAAGPSAGQGQLRARVPWLVPRGAGRREGVSDGAACSGSMSLGPCLEHHTQQSMCGNFLRPAQTTGEDLRFCTIPVMPSPT